MTVINGRILGDDSSLTSCPRAARVQPTPVAAVRAAHLVAGSQAGCPPRNACFLAESHLWVESHVRGRDLSSEVSLPTDAMPQFRSILYRPPRLATIAPNSIELAAIVPHASLDDGRLARRAVA